MMMDLQGSYVINSIGYTPGSTNIAGWKMDPLIEDVFPMENMGDIPAIAMLVYQRVCNI